MGDRGISGYVAGGGVSSRVSLVVPDHARGKEVLGVFFGMFLAASDRKCG